MNSTDETAGALLISADLFFSTKVTGTATQLGLFVDVVGDVARAVAKLKGKAYGCVIIDLSTPALDVAEVMSARTDKDNCPVIAFGPHVLTARLNEAREAGCDEVMPRSKFSAVLPEILARYVVN